MCLDGPSFGQVGWFWDRPNCDRPPRVTPVQPPREPAQPPEQHETNTP